MNIIVIGCEYTGTTTLMLRVQEWMKDSLGRASIFHDHFKLPNNSGHPPLDPDSIIFDEEEKRQVLEMSPKLKELFTRYTLYYHSPTRPMKSTDIGGLHIGHHIDEMIYAPTYFGYGGPGEPGDRRVEAQNVEQGFLKYVPETVLVLMRTSAEVVRSRMRSAPHTDGVVRDEDIEHVLSASTRSLPGRPSATNLRSTRPTPRRTTRSKNFSARWSRSGRRATACGC